MPTANGTSFGRDRRLRKPGDFKHVFAKAKKSSGTAFTVLARQSGANAPRLGLAIAKKHTARAIDRNRIKRIVRESFRLSMKSLATMDFVVLNRKNAQRVSNASLAEELQRHWKRLSDQCVKS